MSQMSYMYAGWGISLVVLAAYSLFVIARGKQLSRRVPRDKRRWTS